MVEKGYEIQKPEIIHSITGSKKSKEPFLELSKFRLYIAFHSIFIGVILLYQSLWLFSKTTTAYCYAYNGEYLVSRGINPGTLVYHYIVDGEMYRETTTRNEIPLTQNKIRIRYFPFMPELSRPDTYASTWLGFQIAWIIFFVITSMIFFIPNETMPRNSYFYFSRQKPWIHMIVK